MINTQKEIYLFKVQVFNLVNFQKVVKIYNLIHRIWEPISTCRSRVFSFCLCEFDVCKMVSHFSWPLVTVNILSCLLVICHSCFVKCLHMSCVCFLLSGLSFPNLIMNINLFVFICYRKNFFQSLSCLLMLIIVSVKYIYIYNSQMYIFFSFLSFSFLMKVCHLKVTGIFSKFFFTFKLTFFLKS